MIETFLKRRFVREFLKSYSEELWKDIIPDVFEIGVLSLEKSFNKILFTKEQLSDIIEDLYNTDYFKSKQRKRLDQLPNRNFSQQYNNINPPYTINNQQDAIQNYPIQYNQQPSNEDIIYQNQARTAYKRRYNYPNNEDLYQNEYYSEQNDNESENCGDNLVMNKLTKSNSMNSDVPINKVNYIITYDKKLRPKSIEKKTSDQNRLTEVNEEEFQKITSDRCVHKNDSLKKEEVEEPKSINEISKRDCQVKNDVSCNYKEISQLNNKEYGIRKESPKNLSNRQLKEIPQRKSKTPLKMRGKQNSQPNKSIKKIISNDKSNIKSNINYHKNQYQKNNQNDILSKGHSKNNNPQNDNNQTNMTMNTNIHNNNSSNEGYINNQLNSNSQFYNSANQHQLQQNNILSQTNDIIHNIPMNGNNQQYNHIPNNDNYNLQSSIYANQYNPNDQIPIINNNSPSKYNIIYIYL